jgi:hypothetical protein
LLNILLCHEETDKETYKVSNVSVAANGVHTPSLNRL